MVAISCTNVNIVIICRIVAYGLNDVLFYWSTIHHVVGIHMHAVVWLYEIWKNTIIYSSVAHCHYHMATDIVVVVESY